MFDDDPLVARDKDLSRQVTRLSCVTHAEGRNQPEDGSEEHELAYPDIDGKPGQVKAQRGELNLEVVLRRGIFLGCSISSIFSLKMSVCCIIQRANSHRAITQPFDKHIVSDLILKAYCNLVSSNDQNDIL